MPKMLPAMMAVGLACVLGTTAMAQTAPAPDTNAAPAPAAVATPAPAAAFVPNGTPIMVEFTDLVSTRVSNRDDWFGLKLAEPVMLNGVVAIPAGTPGKGQVVDMGKPGMAGKPGKLVLAGRYLEFNGKQIPIRGLKMATGGQSYTGTAMAASYAVGIFALAVTGGNMEVPVGTRAVAKLGADFTPDAAAAPTAAPPAAEPVPAKPADAAPAPQTAQ